MQLRWYRSAYFSLSVDYNELLSFVKAAKEHDPFLSKVVLIDDRLGGYKILEAVN